MLAFMREQRKQLQKALPAMAIRLSLLSPLLDSEMRLDHTRQGGSWMGDWVVVRAPASGWG